MSSPLPEPLVEAVGSCTRALVAAAGGGPDRPLDPAAVLAAVPAATPGALRAAGDRLALRLRFHDPAVHRAHAPDAEVARFVFDALEDARLDSLGARWLPGIAQNLIAHPGAADDAVRWLGFEAFSRFAAPGTKAQAVAALRATVPRDLTRSLTALAAMAGEQVAFAPAAGAWARHASKYVKLPDRSGDSPLALHTRTVARALPRRGDPGATSAPLRTRADAATAQGDGTESGVSGITAGESDRFAYRAYTTAYDRIVNAAALARREELAELRVRLEAELSAARPLIARLAKRLMRVLLARQTREWRFDLEEGVLDASRLAPLVARAGRARPFKQEGEMPFPGTVITLLIDHSGSMRGRPMLIAALTVEIFVRVLERCGVRSEVLGFTTRDWDGGEPAREWAAAGYPESPGRLNALEHIVIKAADVPWRRARQALGLFLREEMLKENIDGEALEWAHARLLARSEERRILVVLSDGTPMDEATLAANGHEYLEQHLQSVITRIEARSPVRLAAIGIGHDVSAFYANATRITRIDELGPALSEKLVRLLV